MCTHFFSFVFYDLCWPIEFELEILLFVSNRPCPPALHVAPSVANAMRLQRPLVPQRPRVAAHATRLVASASVAPTRRNKDLGWRSLPAHSGFFRFCLFLRLSVAYVPLCAAQIRVQRFRWQHVAHELWDGMASWGADGDDIAPTAKDECSHTSSEGCSWRIGWRLPTQREERATHTNLMN